MTKSGGVGALGRRVVEHVVGVVAVEGEQRHVLLGVGLLLLHALHGVERLVEAHQRLLLYQAHAAALVHNNQVYNSLGVVSSFSFHDNNDFGLMFDY